MTNFAKPTKGPSSFSLPRAIVNSLIEQNASALEICAMLVLAQHTEGTGVFSTGSVHAVRKRCDANRKSVKKAIEKLRSRRVKYLVTVSSEDGKTIVEERSVPMLLNREDFLRDLPSVRLPDKARQIYHVIPSCDESPSTRVWFGSNLVFGFGEFEQPLKVLRKLTDPAIHLLLQIYATSDMERWGGACPVGDHRAPARSYHLEFINDFYPDVSLYKASKCLSWDFTGILTALAQYQRSLPNALKQLLDSGFVYEVVTVFDAEELTEEAFPLYQLYALNGHGWPVDREHGVARFIAVTAALLGEEIWDKQGQFNHTYGVIAQDDQEICVYGILRPRFRVTNPRNAGVSDGWHAVLERDHEAFRMIQSWRVENDLSELPDPYRASD